MASEAKPVEAPRGGRPQRRWNAIEPQIPALQQQLDDDYEAGLIPDPVYRRLTKMVNRLGDDFGDLVDSLDRMIRLAHVPAGARAA